MALLAIAFIGAFLLAVSVGFLLFYRSPFTERFSALVSKRPGRSDGLLEKVTHRTRRVEALIKPFENILPRSAAETSVVQKRLMRAGYRKPGMVNLFYGAKVVTPILLAAMAGATRVYLWNPFTVFTVALVLGFLLPDFWLSNRIANRKFKIGLGLPEALDLMVICTEAGLGLDQTISRVAAELHLSQPEIRDEFNLILLEQKAGMAREESLKNLAERTGLNTVKALTNTLIQADKYGTNIAKTLRVYSDTMRTQRQQRAEELAAKTTIKLIFPLAIFIFPSLFVVTLGPAVISISENLDKMLNK